MYMQQQNRFNFHECVTKTVGCGRSHEHTNIHIFTL